MAADCVAIFLDFACCHSNFCCTYFAFQNSLDSTAAAKVMAELPSEEETFFGRITKGAKNLIGYER